MNPRNLTREYIEQLSNIEPNCFETDREEQWFNIGLQYGLEAADTHPKSPWISVDDDLPCYHEELTHSNYTNRVLISASNGFVEVAFMSKIENVWVWDIPIKVTHWMLLPEHA